MGLVEDEEEDDDDDAMGLISILFVPHFK